MPQFDVALSYAGEQRNYVEKVANILERKGLSIFYDKFFQSHLWGKNLSIYLHDVFSKKSSFCIMFISKDYVEKAWPTHERKAALEKQVAVEKEYILPVRFDDTIVPGFSEDISYIDANKTLPEELANLFLEKLNDEL